MHHLNKTMESCIEDCTRCAMVCFSTAMHHCLEAGGKHTEKHHFALMMACSEMCKTAATVMLTGIKEHAIVCGSCASICEACAEDCARVGDMDDCVAACKRCAESCRSMAQTKTASAAA